MASYTIRDLERLSGIKAHTIRIWEKRYSLIVPQRTSTNIRTYCNDELKKLLNISILNRNGFKISKIAKLTNDEVIENVTALTENIRDTESQVEQLAIAMIDLDEDKFEKIISRAVIRLGFEDMITKLVYPFFVRIGIMWQTGSINPAQEHFISNLIRQKLIVAIDSLVGNENHNAKTFTLFLPEGELHELGLLFFTYLIKKRGHRVIYLGQTVPFNDVIETIQLHPCDYLLTANIAAMDVKSAKKYFEHASKTFPDKTIYVSGSQILRAEEKLPDNIVKIESPQHFIEELNYISSL